MDQREWDYGTRMSRPRRAAGAWPTREPEIEEPEQRWSSLTDTGSLAPSDEALAWQRRADDWAQQAEVEPYSGGGQAIEPVNRWSSEVTTTGRPTFPADGVGWRTETAEWRATGARWRQTTEWRSSTGSHVWRSTTEAWRAEDEAAEREKPSIPGTAWETGADREVPSWRQSPAVEQPGGTPSWRQPAAETPSWRRNDPDTSSSWQRRPDLPAATTPVEQTPSWRQPSTQMPTWQQPSTQTPGQAPAAQTPSWQQPQQTPSWQQPSAQQPSAPQPSTQTPSWQQPQTPAQPPAASRRRAADTGTGTWSTAASAGTSWTDPGRSGPGENTTGLTRWERTDAPGWQRSAAEDARHLVREDDRAAWRRDSGFGDRPTRVGRRRAAEADPAPSGGTGWSSGSESDNWAGHTDTGSIPVFRDQDEPPAWGMRSEAPSRRDRRRQAEEARPEPARPEPPRAPQARPDQGRQEAPGRRGAQPDRQQRYNANPTNWREDTASWDADQDTSNWTRDPDTGQWSRAGDDPRVLAWRAEAARREAVKDAPEPPARRSRRDEPVGGVPGGPLPSSSIPAGGTSGGGWSAGSAPIDEGRSARRGRPEEAYRADGYPTGRRRAQEPPQAAEEPLGPQAWQLSPEPRQSRQSRRLGVDPEGYPGDVGRSRPDDYPPDGGRSRSRSGGYPGEGGRPGPMPPQWSEPAEPEPRRRAYRDEPEAPRWQDSGSGSGQRELPGGGGYGQQRPEQRSGFGSAARELPAGPSAQPQRPAYGGGQRELPAGPSAQPQQPVYGARELPAAPASGPSWADQERQQRQSPQQRPAYGGGETSWLDQERQQRQAPQRPAYGGGAETSWLDQERQQQPQRGPAYGGQGIPEQPSAYDVPPEQQRRPGFGSARALPAGSSAPASGPAWTGQQKPVYGGGQSSDDLSARWPDPLTDTSSRRGRGDRDDPPPPSGGGFGDRPPLADWLAAERAGRRGADYRGAGQDGETDWRRELSRQNDLAEGESRRYDTSDFPPFRPSGSAAVDGSSNLALSATSVIAAPGAGAGGVAVEEDTSWPPRRAAGAFQGTGSYERRPMGGDFLQNRQNDLLGSDDDEEEQEDNGTPLAAVGYTVGWYGVPVVLFVLGIFVVNSGQSGHAFDTLADAAPGFGIALVLSMVVAYGLRTVTTAWKSASVGLAAAVVGGGLATVLSSAITGNSLS
ncbi:hypothetical protein [Actinoplanes subglobosus]|uniref:Uncharacterized protein n=1 Tax=Actinoplanes subglobosus TaxID=1547892 RepID=A0ABV8IPW1_9ACTN